MSTSPTRQPDGYRELLADLVAGVQTARMRAGMAVNQQLVELYWSMGQAILERQVKEGWGAKVIDQLSLDLRKVFPTMRGHHETGDLLLCRVIALLRCSDGSLRQRDSRIHAHEEPMFTEYAVTLSPCSQSIVRVLDLRRIKSSHAA